VCDFGISTAAVKHWCGACAVSLFAFQEVVVMKTRIFALVIGIAFLLGGVMGFVPALRNIGGHIMPPLAVNATTGFVLGLFPVNVLHNIVHLLVGVLGIGAYSSYGAARGFSWAGSFLPSARDHGPHSRAQHHLWPDPDLRRGYLAARGHRVACSIFRLPCPA